MVSAAKVEGEYSFVSKSSPPDQSEGKQQLLSNGLIKFIAHLPFLILELKINLVFP